MSACGWVMRKAADYGRLCAAAPLTCPVTADTPHGSKDVDARVTAMPVAAFEVIADRQTDPAPHSHGAGRWCIDCCEAGWRRSRTYADVVADETLSTLCPTTDDDASTAEIIQPSRSSRC